MVPGCGRVAMITMVGVIMNEERKMCSFIIKLGKKAGGSTVMVPGHGWVAMTTMMGFIKKRIEFCSFIIKLGNRAGGTAKAY